MLSRFRTRDKLLWATHVGGPNEDYTYVSAVNAQGELYVAGRAGDGFPTMPGAYGIEHMIK